MISNLLKRALAVFGLAAVSLGAPPAAAAEPALWEVSDPDTTIYLFGTIHLLPQDYTWRTGAIDRAIASSDTLVVETLIDTKDPRALAADLARLGFARGLPPIANRIHPDKRPLLEAAIAKSKVPRNVFDQMETWAAAFTLLGVQFRAMGLEGGAGVDHSLREAFTAAGKPVGQLETNAQQLSFFDTLSQDAQRALLEGSIETPDEMSEDFADMLEAWVNGDVEAIADSFNRSLEGSPELRQALLSRRNVTWSQWIARRLATPGTVLLAVGAGHLAGPDSVQTVLQRSGYRVRRVQ